MESPVLSSAEMRTAEEAAFARGVPAEALMDEAAAGIARVVSRFFPTPGRCIVFAGKGNNAGDAFCAAAVLHKGGWEIQLRTVFPEENCGELARKKLRDLQARLGTMTSSERSHAAVVILDGLLGLGSTPPLREPIRGACKEINRLRREMHAYVFALDLPTGFDADSGAADEDCVVADCTVTIGFAKRGLLADGAANFVGRLEVAELAPLRSDAAARASEIVATAASLRDLLPRRKFDSHKNQFGRVGVVAGSRGLTGAAVLCATGALRGGAGLVELFVPAEIYGIIASAAPPEVMVKPIESYKTLLEEPIDVWAIGPGLGRTHATEILQLIKQTTQPAVLDADALNILAEDMQILARAAGPRLLTPHPGEMKRLAPGSGRSRAEAATNFCAQHRATLLLKGSRTIVAEQGKPLSYNTTGTPGMATGGMGDVLTGVCAALLAQKLSPYDAARLGAWVCGRAAEIAIYQGGASEQSLLPTDVLSNLGAAFRELHGSSVTARSASRNADRCAMGPTPSANAGPAN